MHGRNGAAAGFAAVLALGLTIAPAAPASVPSAGGIRYVSKAVRVDGKSTRRAIASCPAGTHVLGGGEATKPGFKTITLEQSFPESSGARGSAPNDGWEVQVHNGTSKRRRVHVDATCAKVKTRYAKLPFTATAHQGTPEEDVSCPAGYFAYSGGLQAPPAAKVRLTLSLPASEADGSTAWAISGYNAGAREKVTAWAGCAKKEQKVVEASEGPVPHGTEASERADCPAHTHAVGGGFGSTLSNVDLAINSSAPFATSTGPGQGWRSATDVLGTTDASLVATWVACAPRL